MLRYLRADDGAPADLKYDQRNNEYNNYVPQHC